MFCCHGKVEGSTGASLAGRGISFGALPLMAASVIVSAVSVAGVSVWMAAANGSEAALSLRKVRRLSMRTIMADHRLRTNRKEAPPGKFSLPFSAVGLILIFSASGMV